MDARDFLTLAERLARENAEVDWRTAVSRAYYAAFHVARELLVACGFTVPRAETAHSYLWLRLNNAGHSAVQQAGASLDGLRRSRNRADYDVARPLAQAVALAEVQVAKDVIQALDAAGQEPVKTQITDAMKVYERDVLKTVTWHP
jgi:uncharacterized protein (UPF0332 family)